MLFFRRTRVYMDYASAPPVSAAALFAMREGEKYSGNPGAIHAEGVAAAAALQDARERIAGELEVRPREVVFTSGLTESNNLAIVGYARALGAIRRGLAGTHWVVSAIEHASVLDCFSEVERLGGTVAYVHPNSAGRITAEAVAQVLCPETVCISVGWANNEIGTIQPLAKIRERIAEHEKKHGTTILFHSDAGQAPLYLPTTAHSLGVDLLSLGSNKLYGPHGIGALYVGKRAELARILHGGPQERKLRAGTESVALALGFAAAYEEAARIRQSEARRLGNLRDTMTRDLLARIPGLVVNGDTSASLPHMLNISIPNVQSEYLTLQLDRAGFAVSTKSACREGEEQESHVVAALGEDAPGTEWRAKNTLRISLGAGTSARDCSRFVSALADFAGQSSR
jgi:cysteine desulfurase